MNASCPVGLFGKTSSATIKNLGVENINLNVVFNNGWWNYNCVGGLVGNQEQGAIINCYSTGTVSSSNTTYDSYSYSCSGGLTGYQTSGTMVNCYSTAAVSSFSRTYEVYSYSWAGGLVGVQENGTIANCYSTGSVTSDSIAPPSGDSSSASFSNAGGLAASHHASIQKCYSTGQVSATGRYINKGGLIGYSYATPTACFWDTQTSGMTTSAGGSGVQGKTTAEMQTLSTFTNAGWDFTNETANGTNDIWRMCVDGVDYPRLNWESIEGDFKCPDGVAIEDLDYFVGRWLLDNCTADNNYCGGADIDVSGKVDLADWAVFAEGWMEGI